MRRKKGESNLLLSIIKIFIFIAVLALQGVVFVAIYRGSIMFSNSFRMFSTVLQAIIIIYILYGHEKLAYKIPWLIIIAFLPIGGIIIYFVWGKNRVSKKMKEARDKTIANSHYLLPSDEDIVKEIAACDRQVEKQVKLLKNLTNYPVYRSESVKYFDIGEEYFESLLSDLKDAKKYILMEYFILAKGKLFDRIYDVLNEKAKKRS